MNASNKLLNIHLNRKKLTKIKKKRKKKTLFSWMHTDERANGNNREYSINTIATYRFWRSAESMQTHYFVRSNVHRSEIEKDRIQYHWLFQKHEKKTCKLNCLCFKKVFFFLLFYYWIEMEKRWSMESLIVNTCSHRSPQKYNAIEMAMERCQFISFVFSRISMEIRYFVAICLTALSIRLLRPFHVNRRVSNKIFETEKMYS